MDDTLIVPRLSRDDRPPTLLIREGEDELVRRADELAEQEGIPIEAAWSIVCRHHTLYTVVRDG